MPGRRPDRWSMMMPEIMVSNHRRSLAFWCGILGFAVAYDRPWADFFYLERPEGGQMMLYRRDGGWETGAMEPPFGRGVVLQVYVDDLAPVEAAVRQAGLPFYEAPRERWRHWGDREGGQREFLVQDPDGYLVMVAQRIGERPITPPDAAG